MLEAKWRVEGCSSIEVPLQLPATAEHALIPPLDGFHMLAVALTAAWTWPRQVKQGEAIRESVEVLPCQPADAVALETTGDDPGLWARQYRFGRFHRAPVCLGLVARASANLFVAPERIWSSLLR